MRVEIAGKGIMVEDFIQTKITIPTVRIQLIHRERLYRRLALLAERHLRWNGFDDPWMTGRTITRGQGE